jgi:hypothetical protein
MKAAFNLDHLRVATPCPKEWDDMVGDDRVRFCDHCHLNVYNLAELTQKETQRLISSSEGRLCGRLYRRADGTVLTKDCPVGLQALRKRISRRAAAVFATLLGLSSTVFAQNSKEKDSCQPQIRITKTQKLNDEKPLLAGSIFDPNGAVISGAAVLVKNIKTGFTRQVSTNDQGQFTFPSLTEGPYSLTITLAPFKSLAVQEVKLEEETALNVDMTLEFSGREVVGLLMASPSIIDTPPGSFTISGDLLIRLPH